MGQGGCLALASRIWCRVAALGVILRRAATGGGQQNAEKSAPRQGDDAMKRVIPLVIIALTAIAILGVGQDAASDSMTFGPVTLRLGMKKETVLAALAVAYEVRPSGSTGRSFFITTKNGASYDYLGSFS